MYKEITLTHLIQVLQKIGASHEEELSGHYIREAGLVGHITFPKPSQNAPVLSEQRRYTGIDTLITDLEIELDHSPDAKNWGLVYPAQVHFEGCRFQVAKGSDYTFNFPRSEALWFRKNSFCFPPYPQGPWPHGEDGIFHFNFGKRSKVWFAGNEFGGARVFLHCVNPTAHEVNPSTRYLGHLSCMGNRGIGLLSIAIYGFSSIEITGMNQIDWLQIEDDITGRSVYLGPREKIDSNFYYHTKHRALFLRMRENAARQEDSRQLVILNRQLDRIEYYLNKQQDPPSIWELGNWSEYWEDRLIYAWKRWSSDFYKSWLRPLFFLLAGYLLINALPYLWVENFEFFHWLDLSLRPITDIPRYEASVSRMIGSDYQNVSEAHRRLLKAVGLVQVIWVGVWSFALLKAMKR